MFILFTIVIPILYAVAMDMNILMTLIPPLSRANGKRKNHSGFSILWDIINSWLDIQIEFEKNVLGRKSPALNKILNIQTPKGINQVSI